jgi:hypothetical protein
MFDETFTVLDEISWETIKKGTSAQRVDRSIQDYHKRKMDKAIKDNDIDSFSKHHKKSNDAFNREMKRMDSDEYKKWLRRN